VAMGAPSPAPEHDVAGPPASPAALASWRALALLPGRTGRPPEPAWLLRNCEGGGSRRQARLAAPPALPAYLVHLTVLRRFPGLSELPLVASSKARRHSACALPSYPGQNTVELAPLVMSVTQSCIAGHCFPPAGRFYFSPSSDAGASPTQKRWSRD